MRKRIFGWFNAKFDRSVNHYTNSVSGILRCTGRYLIIYLLIVVGMAVLFMRLPTSFLPDEDQGVFMTMIQLPSGATQERTQKVLDTVTDYYLHKEKANVESVFTVNGFSFSGQGQNSGMAFVSLKPWEERSGAENGVEAIIKRATVAFSQIKDAMVFPFNLPAIIELGTATGFDFELIDQGNLGHSALTLARNQLLGMVREHPDQLVRVRPNGLEDTPQFKLDVDQEKAQALGISLSDINETISAALGGYYVNDFIDHGRVKKSTFRPMQNSVCCRAISIICTSAARMAKWFRSPPLSPHAGFMVHRAWSAIMAYPLWKFWVKLLRGKVPAMR